MPKAKIECPECHGKGIITDMFGRISICSKCHGTGWIWSDCPC